MASAIVVPSSLVEQACAVAAQQGWYKVEASYSLPCGSRASIVGWRPNTPAEHAHARAPQSVAPPQEAQEQVANKHVASTTTTSEKEAASKVPSKAQKKRERAKRKANNLHAAVSDRRVGCAPQKIDRLPAPRLERRPESPLAGVEHAPKRPRSAHEDPPPRGRPPDPEPSVQVPLTGPVRDRDESAHVAAPTLPSQVDERREPTKHGAEGGDGKLLQELDALFEDAQDKASDDESDDDDLPPEEEHEDDCDCGFCGPCGAWAWARGEHPRQRAAF
jgi:hypothetical protein